MSDTTVKKRRKLTSLELSAPARGAHRRLCKKTGLNKTRAIEKALAFADTHPDFQKLPLI